MQNLPPCHGIIPARYQSIRFPGKPLADILGRPMIWHVYERARQCRALSSVVLATDDDRIRSAAQNLDIPVVMTRADHPSGTDRVLEAAVKLGLDPDSVVVNIQGDEPALEPSMLTELVAPFSNPEIEVTTLARKISDREAENPDLVKVVFTADRRAVYFSRSAIPFRRRATDHNFHGHIGIYALRMRTLNKFVSLDQSRLEITEKLEQLRLIENNIPIHIVETEHRSIGVDRPEDIEAVSQILSGGQSGR
ncbi:MAG: 3-deoxy-manno-octulosonate cytidylyltransferase [bacterium]|nr:3-deoxy-manno-octulosonate cytidylyltransferase [bacterium]